jgi:hypothetical protein
MAAFLSEDQRLALGSSPGQSPVPIFDPRDNSLYYLVPAAVFHQMRHEAGELALEAAYPLMDEVAKSEGWDDPAMDAYDQLDPRKQP